MRAGRASVYLKDGATEDEVEALRGALTRVRGVTGVRYLSSADARTEFGQRELSAKSELAAIPSAKRRVITSHDGFEYLARAYDIEMTPARGMVNDTDPSADDIARLIQQIRTTKVKAIFIENMNDPRLIERVAREAGASIGGTLYSDALSKPGGEADSYLKMVRHNVSALKAAMLKN